MAEVINKQTLEKLAGLARIEISKNREEKLLSDLKAILGHFDELKEVDVSDIKPMSGGVELINVIREDEPIESETEAIDLIESFPEKEGRFLKVPPVFPVEGGFVSDGE
jgi:aspartyl-tRNA(Asn)/glutamyl-tRNA(Gln) amidotransferase subunit C